MSKELLKKDLDYISDVIDNWKERPYSDVDFEAALKILNERYEKKDVESKRKEYIFINDIILSKKMYNEYHKYIGYVYCLELEESNRVNIHFDIDDDITIFEEIDSNDISTLDRLYDYTFDEIKDIFGKDFYSEFIEYVNGSLYRSPIWDLKKGKAFLFKDEDSIDDLLLKRRQILAINEISDRYISFYQLDFDTHKKVDVNAVVEYGNIIKLEDLLKKTIIELREIYPTKYRDVYDYLMCQMVYDFATDANCDTAIDKCFTLHCITSDEYDTSKPTIGISKCNNQFVYSDYSLSAKKDY